MQTIFIIFLSVGLAVALAILFALNKKLQNLSSDKGNDQMFMMLQQQMQELNRSLDSKMGETRETLQSQFSINTKFIQETSGKNHQLITEVTEKLTNLERTNQQVIGFSEQLSNLEKVLTHQKNRGSLGEAGLQLVLENILPPTAFKLQYEFPDGDVVDAAIFCKDGLIPVDSKFSLDNYNRVTREDDPVKKAELEKEFKNDLKKRIDETSKYIKPKFGTLDFAFMFIPAEGIYYDLLVNEVGALKVNTRNLMDYAFKEKHVIIVSPTTFAAYLLTVLQGLRAFQIEESAVTIREHVETLGRHIVAYEDYMKKLGNNISTTVNSYNTAYKELGKIDKDVTRITKGEKSIEPLSLEKPRSEEES